MRMMLRTLSSSSSSSSFDWLSLLVVVAAVGFAFATATTTPTTTTAKSSLELANEQIEWLRAKGGYYNPKVSIQPLFEAPESDHDVPLGLFAHEKFHKGEKLMVVPRHCLLASEDMCDTARRLVYELELQEQSDFAPYVAYLFSKDSVPIPSAWSLDGQDLLQTIRGRNLPPKDLTDVSYEHHCIEEHDDEESSTPLLEFAYLTVVSRAWNEYLVPVYDMINHHSGRYANVDSTRVLGRDDITIFATRDVTAGEQLFLSYMDCIDEQGYELEYVLPQLLRDFGFVDQYPQRWTFPVPSGDNLVFDLDFVNPEADALYLSLIHI